MKRILSVLMSAALLAEACPAVLAEEAPKAELFRESRVYDGRLDRFEILPTYHVEGWEEVPFVKIGDLCSLAYQGTVAAEKTDDGLLLTRNGASVTVDCVNNAVWSEDWDNFFGRERENLLPNGILMDEELNAIKGSVKNQAAETEASGYGMVLTGYGMEFLPFEGDVLLPFAAAQSIFRRPGEAGYAFNGEDYFNLTDYMDHIYGNLLKPAEKNAYADKYFSGPFSKASHVSQAYAAYFYGSVCIELDLHFGHKTELEVNYASDYIEKNGLKEAMLSGNVADMADAMNRLVDLFSSGHDSVLIPRTVFAQEGSNSADARQAAAAELQEYMKTLLPEGAELTEDAMMEVVQDLSVKAAGGDEEAKEKLIRLLTLGARSGDRDAEEALQNLTGGAPAAPAQQDAGEEAALQELIAFTQTLLPAGEEATPEKIEAVIEGLTEKAMQGDQEAYQQMVQFLTLSAKAGNKDAENALAAMTGSPAAESAAPAPAAESAAPAPAAESAASEEEALQELKAFVMSMLPEGAELTPEAYDEVMKALGTRMTEGDQEAYQQMVQFLTLAAKAGNQEAAEALAAMTGAAADGAAAGAEEKHAINNMQDMMKVTLFFMGAKPADYGDVRVDLCEDTAVIYFAGFEEDIKRASFYLEPPTEADMAASTFALFYHAFELIKEDGGIKNVVINLADNHGGAAAALISALGFLSPDGEANLTYWNQVSENYCSEWYHVDTNLDGVFDDEDGYGGQYNFYILSSGLAYSCGNALPYFAQRDGLATIIGSRPGGGDCVVNPYTDALGELIFSSGPNKLGTLTNGEFVSNEFGTTVDLPFPEEVTGTDYFDVRYITDFIHNNAAEAEVPAA